MAVKKKKKAAKAATKRKAALRKTTRIRYKCLGNLCSAVPKRPHLGPLGSTAELEAVKTDVTITFIAGSPFKAKKISIAAGKMTSRTVVNKGKFPYKVECSECEGEGSGPPEMIVP